jgi:hypothetical protein
MKMTGKMIWKNAAKSAILVMTMFSMVLTSCKREDSLFDGECAEDDNKVGTIEDDNSLASDFLAAENVGGRSESTEGNKFLGVATITFDAATRTVTIDFGTTNQMCADGKNRRGKIFVKMEEGTPNQFPYTSVTTHENYFVNDNKVEGTRRERKTVLSNTSLQTEITVTNRKVSFTDGTSLTRNVNHVRVKNLVANGIEYSITGTANGTNRRGRNYTSTILSPLISKTSCNNFLFPVKGTLNLGVNGDNDKFLLDFGDGSCDKTFTITYNGKTKTITR